MRRSTILQPANDYCKLPTLSDNHFAPDLRDRLPSSPRPRSGARFCACFSLPTFATGGGAFQERGMCPYLLSLKVGSLRYGGGVRAWLVSPALSRGFRALRSTRVELRCRSPRQLLRSFQRADGFPDPWPVFITRPHCSCRPQPVVYPHPSRPLFLPVEAVVSWVR